MANAVATSLFVIAINSFAGFAAYVGSVAIDPRVAALVTLAAVAGSFVGARWAGRVNPQALRRGFAWFVLAMGVFMVARQTTLAAAAIVAGVGVVGAWLVTPRSTSAKRATRTVDLAAR